MRHTIIFILSIIVTTNLTAQLLNNEFDDWVTIDSIGEPYEDLLFWDTNNEVLGNGFATTPNIRIAEGDDNGISLTTNYQGIDGHYSGIISQVIPTERLKQISFLSKCDSIFEGGACIVNIYDGSNQLVYSDSLKSRETDYSQKFIEIEQIPNLVSDLIRIEFIAFGQLGPFEPMQAYSEFNLLSVHASFITSTSNLDNGQVGIYPNPFSNNISIALRDDSKYLGYRLFNSSGVLISEGTELKIETMDLVAGVYYLKVNTSSMNLLQKVIKQ